MKQDGPRTEAKPFDIPKRLTWDAWKRVAANKGAPGVDKESITVPEKHWIQEHHKKSFLTSTLHFKVESASKENGLQHDHTKTAKLGHEKTQSPSQKNIGFKNTT